MNVPIDIPHHEAGSGLRDLVQARAQRVLGRLARRVSRIAVAVREHAHPQGSLVNVCTLRVRLAGSSDVVVETLRPGQEAAVTAALRRARREILRRRRALPRVPGLVAGPSPA